MQSTFNARRFFIALCLTMILTGCKSKSLDATEGGTDNPVNTNFSGGIFHITTGGSYIFSGEHEGQILIETANNEVVELVLDGLTLRNPNNTAIYSPRSGRIDLIIIDGSANSIVANAAIFTNDELFISGNGTLTMETIGHAIEAGSATMNGGNLIITAQGKGITTIGSVLVTGGSLLVIDSDEGIEGFNVTITGGDINIFARDDAINARDSEEPTGGTRGRFGINQEMFVRIAGGNLNLHGLRDGIDSNGNTFLDGGTLKITAPSTRFGDDAIDQDGIFVVTGGELITAGTIRSVSPLSTQPVLIITHNRRLPAGTLIEIRDTAGNVILNYQSRDTFPASGFTSPQFIVGRTYRLFINGQQTDDITLTGLVTNIRR